MKAAMAQSQDAPDMDVCARYLKALADPVRLRIVQTLQAGPLSVTDLVLLLELDVVKVSHHLRVLFHANLVKSQKEGRFVYYQLNTEFRKTSHAGTSLNFGCCRFDFRG